MGRGRWGDRLLGVRGAVRWRWTWMTARLLGLVGCWNASGSCPTPASAWSAALAGRIAGDRRGGGAGRWSLVRRDRAVLPHAAPGDPGTAGDLAAAVLQLACCS